MLTEVKAYSSLSSAPTLLLEESGRSETDLIQIRNIDGLDPVKASVSASPFGDIDGVSITGSKVESRNIVLTIHPNPDWDTWTYEGLRKLLYSYFMPKSISRLEFYSNDMVPVEISGVVESFETNMFSSDPEFIISIICPDPYFTAIEPTVILGQTDNLPTIIEYNGTIEAGTNIKLTATEDTEPSDIVIQIGDPSFVHFSVAATVDSTKYFEVNSLPMRKFVQNVDLDSDEATNLLSRVYFQQDSLWPVLRQGDNLFFVFTDVGVHDWTLTYFERFGGL